jgi:carboxyl-terminal processing protease
MRNPRFLPVAVLAIALSALAGGLFGSRALARQDEVTQQFRVFTAALDAIDREYVDEVPSDRVIYSAIDGRIHTPDTHSSSSTQSYAQMRLASVAATAAWDHDSVDRRRHHGDVDLRSSPATRRIAPRQPVEGRRPDMKGWTTDQAVKNSKGAQGHARQRQHQAPRV